MTDLHALIARVESGSDWSWADAIRDLNDFRWRSDLNVEESEWLFLIGLVDDLEDVPRADRKYLFTDDYNNRATVKIRELRASSSAKIEKLLQHVRRTYA